MHTFWQDLRYGARMLVKQPGFTLIAVLALALGIGANTALFSVINTVLLGPLPFPEPERLMTVGVKDLRTGTEPGSMSYPDFADWRAKSTSFEGMAVYRTTGLTLTEVSEPIRLDTAIVSAELFNVLRVGPAQGRVFTADEDKPGTRVVVLGHNLWQRRFNADPAIVGRALTLNNQSYTVIGVMPAGFQFPIQSEAVELWTTVAVDMTTTDGSEPMTSERGNHYLQAIGRLKPGVPREQAQAELENIAAALRTQFPDTNTNFGASLISLADDLVGDVRLALWMLFGAVGFVLLIACANVANLLLARAATRHREIAVRSALGANRWRVVRQLLTESLLLACLGSALGWFVALWGTELLVALSPSDLPRVGEIALDGRVLGFTLMIAMATGVLFGLVPALQASRSNLAEDLKEGGRGASDGLRRNRLRGALVIAEVAIALILMVGAGLLVNSFWRLRQVNPGFDARNVVTMRVNLPAARYTDPQIVEFYERLQARLQQLPGVRAASAGMLLPLGNGQMVTTFGIEGRPVAQSQQPRTNAHIVAPGYFDAMGIRLVKGRDFTVRDTATANQVVIVNETLARRNFPNEDPIGKRIRPGVSAGPGDAPMREIIGVVGDVRFRRLSEAPNSEVYLPHAQVPVNGMALVVRADGDPHGVIGAVRNEVLTMDSNLPVHSVRLLDEFIGNSLAQQRFSTLVLLLFALVALLLTAVGLYGVVAYSVTQRTHEIGIRVALGAQTRNALALVLRQGMMLSLTGVGIGLAGSFVLTRFLQTLLFGVRANDPLTFALIAVLLLAVALVACYIPARRATKVDPMVALRCE